VDPPADQVVGWWGFVTDTDDSWVTGELLLRRDGTLLRRYGGGSYKDGHTWWRFNDWEPVGWWPGHTDVNVAIRALKAKAYDLCEPGPVPINERTAGPFEGAAAAARYL